MRGPRVDTLGWWIAGGVALLSLARGRRPKGRPADGVMHWLPLAREAHARYPNVPIPLILATIDHESGGDPTLTGGAGDAGLMQLIPSTQAMYHVHDPYDPAQSIEGGTHLLSDNLKRYGTVRRALSAYNSGGPDTWAHVEKVRRYVETGLALLHKYDGVS